MAAYAHLQTNESVNPTLRHDAYIGPLPKMELQSLDRHPVIA